MSDVDFRPLRPEAEGPPVIVAVFQCYNEADWIPYSMGSIYGEVDRIILIEGGLRGRPNTSMRSADGSLDLVKALDRDDKVTVVQKFDDYWNSLEEMKAAIDDHVRPGEWVLIDDADEVHTPEDIRRARRLVAEHPDIGEFIPVFLHFVGDFHHIVRPSPGAFGANILHQRFLRWGEKYTFRYHHPTAVDARLRDTCLYPDYQARRMVVQDWYIWHFGRCKPVAEQTDKHAYYRLVIDGMPIKEAAAAAPYDAIGYWRDHPECILEFSGELPEVMKGHPLHGKRLLGTGFDDWLSVAEYREKRLPNIYSLQWEG